MRAFLAVVENPGVRAAGFFEGLPKKRHSIESAVVVNLLRNRAEFIVRPQGRMTNHRCWLEGIPDNIAQQIALPRLFLATRIAGRVDGTQGPRIANILRLAASCARSTLT